MRMLNSLNIKTTLNIYDTQNSQNTLIRQITLFFAALIPVAIMSASITAAATVLAVPLLTIPACTVPPVAPEAFTTPAESTDFTTTSRYDDILAYLRNLDRRSGFMRLEFFGRTAENRAMPLAVLGNPPPKSPNHVDRNRTTVVYINANIHAGEVSGKEACLLLIRDIALGASKDLLEGTVVLVNPIYNADGNERIDERNRYWQPGPEVGIRTNAQSLDLNRDMMKLESPEAQSMVDQVLIHWDPHLVVDCHTTNGSYHREPITYAPPHTPFCDPKLLRFQKEVMFPWVAKETREREGYDAIPYGNFKSSMEPEKGWSSFGHRPRYVTNYIGMRNRLSILIEMYVYAEYEMRIRACKAFLHSIVDFCGTRGKDVRSVTRQADARYEKEALRYHARFEEAEPDGMITVKGYRMEMGEDARGRRRPRPILDEPVDYQVPYFGTFRPADEGAPLPEAYLFPRALVEVREKLDQHGIRVEEISMPFKARVQAFAIEKIEGEPRLYQGHRCTRIEGKWASQEVSFPGGAYRVPTAQPLALLAAYLLEPESDDGLLFWNFMDRYLQRGVWDSRPGTYPVVRVTDAPEPAVEGSEQGSR